MPANASSRSAAPSVRRSAADARWTCSAPSAQPARLWPPSTSSSPANAENARPCACCWPPVRRRARLHRGHQGQGSGRCLDITGGSQANGALAAIWDCNGAANQRFTSTSSGELRVYGGAKCLDVVGAASANGTAVNIWDCNGQSNQQFRLNTDGTITAVHSGKCLDVNGGATANGTKVQIWDCGGTANQTWTRV
ncbi:RICIN domain-containing protein [Streptomyces sp. NBC_00076]|uniref:RICIN domain-containing protein n=1 Tax=Streptomyces sp. NBC_00076 TaxID=2975642 RepID=UPI003254062D